MWGGQGKTVSILSIWKLIYMKHILENKAEKCLSVKTILIEPGENKLKGQLHQW